MNSYYQGIAKEVLGRVSLEPLRGQTVLVTGSNGLIGSHLISVIALANRLLNLRAQVTCLSRSEPAIWIREILEEAKFEFFRVDLAQSPIGQLRSFDFVIHAATYGQPKKFLEDPLATMKLNSTVTLSLLELASRKSGNFLYMSSSEIYGDVVDPGSLPLKEEFHGTVSPLDKRAAYTSSKRFGETLCKIFDDKKLTRARVARISSIYGPGIYLKDDRVLNVFVLRALREGQIKMLDRGNQRRRWLYISDGLVMLFYILLYSKELVYNVGGTDLRSIAELAGLIARETGARVVPSQEGAALAHTFGAPTVIDMSIDRILKEAGMSDLLPLHEGLKPCIGWARQLLRESAAC